jgi:hypothetical protein
MSKAKQRAKERYWLEPSNIDTQNKYQAYLEGYYQAQKDLALTLEDINKIEIIIKDVYRDYPHGIEIKQFGQEVLKRFKERKEK